MGQCTVVEHSKLWAAQEKVDQSGRVRDDVEGAFSYNEIPQVCSGNVLRDRQLDYLGVHQDTVEPPGFRRTIVWGAAMKCVERLLLLEDPCKRWAIKTLYENRETIHNGQRSLTRERREIDSLPDFPIYG
jgi:hypothetical protein